MHAPQEPFSNEHRTETLADVRDHMNRRGDSDPAGYTHDPSFLESLAASEVVTIEGEVLA